MLIAVTGEDAKFCSQLAALLSGQSHNVSVVPWSPEPPRSLVGAPPHLLVVVAPDSTAALQDFLRRLRGEGRLKGLPVLCVNPKAGSAEGVASLDAGADDFINRPFNGQIFLARVRTLLRRLLWSGQIPEDPVTTLTSGSLSLNLVSREILAAGEPVTLTRLEFDLLAFLLRHPEKVFKRQDILEAIWNYPQQVETRTLDKHVETLRRKLGALASCIQTVHGVGYRFKPDGAGRPSPTKR